MRYLGVLLLACLTLNAAQFSDVEELLQHDPRRAYDLSLAPLTATTLDAHASANWHVLASEAAYALALTREAQTHANDGLQALGNHSDSDLRLRLLIAKAQASDMNGDSELALKILNQVLAEIEAQHNEVRLLDALLARGVAYTTLIRSTEALADLRRAYTLAPTHSERVERADVAAAIGNLYSNIRQLNDASYFYEEAIARHRQTNNRYKLAVETYSLALTRMRLEQYASAQQLMLESKQLCEAIDDRQGVAFARYGLAEIAREQGHYREGYQDYLFAVQWFRQAGDNYSLISALRGLALARMDLGQINAAQIDINEAMNFAATQDDKSLLLNVHQTHAMILAAAGDHKRAYEEQQIYQKLSDQINKERMSITTAELRVKFEADKRQQENVLLQKENSLKEAELGQQKQRNSLYFLSLALAISLIGFLAYFTYKQKQTREKLALLAQTDVLTGLHNRRRLIELAEIEFERSRRYCVEFCVALLDLDHFKKINDHYGHECGDYVLREFAQFCKQTLRQTDVIGRWGGEEFVAVLAHTNLTTAAATLERLCMQLTQRTLRYNGQPLQVTVSIGVAQLQGDADFTVLLNRADHALYGAKNSGRNRVKTAAIVRDASHVDEQHAAHNYEVL